MTELQNLQKNTSNQIGNTRKGSSRHLSFQIVLDAMPALIRGSPCQPRVTYWRRSVSMDVPCYLSWPPLLVFYSRGHKGTPCRLRQERVAPWCVPLPACVSPDPDQTKQERVAPWCVPLPAGVSPDPDQTKKHPPNNATGVKRGHIEVTRGAVNISQGTSIDTPRD